MEVVEVEVLLGEQKLVFVLSLLLFKLLFTVVDSGSCSSSSCGCGCSCLVSSDDNVSFRDCRIFALWLSSVAEFESLASKVGRSGKRIKIGLLLIRVLYLSIFLGLFWKRITLC